MSKEACARQSCSCQPRWDGALPPQDTGPARRRVSRVPCDRHLQWRHNDAVCHANGLDARARDMVLRPAHNDSAPCATQGGGSHRCAETAAAPACPTPERRAGTKGVLRATHARTGRHRAHARRAQTSASLSWRARAHTVV